MERIKCKECGKIIEGYKSEQVQYLLWQHELVHRRAKLRMEKKELEK